MGEKAMYYKQLNMLPRHNTAGCNTAGCNTAGCNTAGCNTAGCNAAQA